MYPGPVLWGVKFVRVAGEKGTALLLDVSCCWKTKTRRAYVELVDGRKISVDAATLEVVA